MVLELVWGRSGLLDYIVAPLCSNSFCCCPVLAENWSGHRQMCCQYWWLCSLQKLLFLLCVPGVHASPQSSSSVDQAGHHSPHSRALPALCIWGHHSYWQDVIASPQHMKTWDSNSLKGEEARVTLPAPERLQALCICELCVRGREECDCHCDHLQCQGWWWRLFPTSLSIVPLFLPVFNSPVTEWPTIWQNLPISVLRNSLITLIFSLGVTWNFYPRST